MWGVIADAALLLIALLLVAAGLAKTMTSGRDERPGMLTRLGPAILVPRPWRRPAMIACGVGELMLAAGLILTSDPLFRWGTAAFFAVGAYVLGELRRRHPDTGCGCFGEVSAAPVGWQAILRAILLAGTALVVLAAPAPGWAVATGLTQGHVATLAAALLVFAVISPEVGELIERIRYRAPCEVRPASRDRSLARLRGSRAWRERADLISSNEPYDIWREACWHFFVFPGHAGDVVFAIYLSGRRPAIRSAVVDPADHAVLTESKAVSLQR